MISSYLKQTTNRERLSKLTIIVLTLILFIAIGLSNSSVFCTSTKDYSTDYAIDLESDTVVSQRIPDDIDHIKSIAIKFGTYARQNTGTLIIKLYEDNTVIYQWERDTAELLDNSYADFPLNTVLNKNARHDYYFTIENNYEGDNVIAVWAANTDNEVQLNCKYTIIDLSLKARMMIIIFIFLIETVVIVFLTNTTNLHDNQRLPVKTTSKVINYLLIALCTSLISISLYCYISETSEKFSLTTVKPYVYVITISTIAFVAISLFATNYKNGNIPFILYWLVLFLIYILRVPEDAFTPYLWAEDGCILLQESMNQGISSLMNITSGTHWLAPRLVALFSYHIGLLFDDLSIFPILQGLICKAIAVSSISYFLSNRFEWLIKEKSLRFLICVTVILSIPYYDTDVTTCDTSTPFIMFFAVFLIGLNAFCNRDIHNISCLETGFLSIAALSNAAAPFAGGIALLSFVRWLILTIKDKNTNVKHTTIESIKVIIVCGCVLIQLLGIHDSGRAGNEIDLYNRLSECLRHFVFIPYFSTYRSWSLFFIAFVGFLSIAYLSHIPWKVLLYSSIYSFSHLFYCSMTTIPSNITTDLFPEPNPGGRYILMCYCIAGFIFVVELCYLLKSRFTAINIMGLVLFLTMLSVSTLTYAQIIQGKDYSDSYRESIDVFDRNGSQTLYIPIGPWNPYMIGIPWDESNYSYIDGGVVNNYVDSVNGYTPDSVILSDGMISIIGWASTSNGEPFDHVFIKINEDGYVAPYAVYSRPDIASLNNQYFDEYGYRFNIESAFIANGDLEFIGITQDGRLYRWNTYIAIDNN